MFYAMIVDGIHSNLEKCFIVMNLCLFDMESQGFEVIFKEMLKSREVEKIGHIEHVCCSNFLGLLQLCLYFFDIFPR